MLIRYRFCNLSLAYNILTSFLTVVLHKVVWQHMVDVVGFLIKFYSKFSRESASERILKIGQYLTEISP